MYKAAAKVYIWDKADIGLAFYNFSLVYTLIGVYYRGDISRGRSLSRYQDSSYFTQKKAFLPKQVNLFNYSPSSMISLFQYPIAEKRESPAFFLRKQLSFNPEKKTSLSSISS